MAYVHLGCLVKLRCRGCLPENFRRSVWNFRTNVVIQAGSSILGLLRACAY